MNQSELIDRLSEQTGNTKTKTKELLGNAIDVLTKQLMNGNGVSVPNLGTFSTKVNPEKKVYNPHYEAYMLVPEKRVVEFTPAAGLKDDVKFIGNKDE
ncbi:MAG: HU family DNA-binding protein [Balneolaceae bacterium]|nr:MAG: HU family DNA-binding protein [Balneolaceae bacterium]